ncbi:cilia- and flagella-associated protein 45-like isoform X2 [Zootermopsis nevadensis]|nr:cilia- and flagella-associated protein 45-like isoform X2 [Zootermopsis nevadensis]XP_021935546.1 cilia- and flagella-associated protein 45-like isoform X2 [Zootermopsis nevadensis]XP_021935547.1 cilia- and flagella-associated protein 45-like isoform X2 [Zootermopsis nevadensis]
MAPQNSILSHQRCETNVSKNSRKKQHTKSETGLASTPRKRTPGGKEVIHIVKYDDKIRELIVPSLERTVHPTLLDINEFNRIKQQAKVITMQDRLHMLEEADKRNNELMQKCKVRKDEMCKWSQKQKHGQKYSLLESHAHHQATHLLRRAFEMKQDQEDEVKRANRLIMGIKCHAIRDAQIAERKQIEKDLEDEERCLDQMMEEERRRALLDEEKREEKEQLKKGLYVKQIQQQIKEKEMEKILELEHKEEESRLITEAQVQATLDEIEAYNKKVAQQKQMRDDLNEINRQIEHFHALEQEKSHINDLRVQEYMRLKAEREMAREKELKAHRMAREREIARLMALQQHQQDLQAEAYELNALRMQEEVEREFRNKERAAMRKKKENDAAIKKAREEQILDRRRMEALEIACEKQTFKQVLKAQKEAAEKQRLDDLKKKHITQQYRSDIIKQINEKEHERIKKKQSKFEEEVALKMEELQRQGNMKDAIKKKIEELRIHKVPQVYIKEIERQLKLR